MFCLTGRKGPPRIPFESYSARPEKEAVSLLSVFLGFHDGGDRMYAIIESGGKQRRVSPGALVTLEKIDGEAGSQVELSKVLLVADGDQVRVGTPYLQGARVMTEIVRQGRGPKITVFKFKRRKRYRRTQGHRQAQTTVRIKEIRV
jgi:large subunit ribosomal protein L21